MTSKQITTHRLADRPVMGRQLALVFEPDTAPLHPAKAAALARRIPPGWPDLAACAASENPEAWFPSGLADRTRADDAMRTCRSCPVRRGCLAVALLRREVGIWGGTNQPDRDQALNALCRGSAVDAVLDLTLTLADADGPDSGRAAA